MRSRATKALKLLAMRSYGQRLRATETCKLIPFIEHFTLYVESIRSRATHMRQARKEGPVMRWLVEHATIRDRDTLDQGAVCRVGNFTFTRLLPTS